MSGWTQAILWLSLGLYGYLIVHHTLQAFLSRQKGLNWRLVGFLVSSLLFSFFDQQLYRSDTSLTASCYPFALGQFLASSVCATLFVCILNEILDLDLKPLGRFLVAITGVLVVLAPFGFVLAPSLEGIYLPLLGVYYLRAESTLLGQLFSLVYLTAFLFVYIRALKRWRQMDRYDRILTAMLALMIPLVVVDMAVYYGFFSFVPTWNWAYFVIALALSIRLNAEIYQLNSELEQANLEIQQAYRQMVEQERLSTIGQIVRGIVHDLKNYFNTVQSLADVGVRRLQRDPEFDPADYFQSIGLTTRQAHGYLLDLLAITKEEGDAHLEWVSPCQIVQEVQRLSGAHLLNPPVQIENHLPLNLQIHADRRYLMQMYLNLTLNAIQVLKDWEGTRKVIFDWYAEGNETVLTIRDTGPGMPEEVRATLFQQAITTKQGGTGIGLMLVWRAVQKHHGSITVQSEPGQGTTFIVRLPTPAHLEQVDPEAILVQSA
ncbi:MAG: HAMP domain-containing sensor histidine kinase [Fimbriimonadales bacterium]